MRFPAPRSIFVASKLLPFIIGFIRDWRKYLFFGPPRELTQKQHQRRARAIRETMATLGPSFIKAAQVLAMREDLLSPTYTKELVKLQDQVPPFPYREVSRIIRRNYNKPVQELFDEFEKEPIAAASLGQVHKARYKGREVAVKVLRPGVEELVSTDMNVVRILLAILDMFIDPNLMRSFHAIAEEFERMIHLEMDFRNERKNAARFRHNFHSDTRIRVPHFVDELTTHQVAVSEFIKGGRIDDPETLAAVGMDPKYLIDLMIETYVRMAVVHGFIHADPHPGNLFIDAQGKLVILDFGMALEFDDDTKLELLKIVYAVVKRDVDGIVDGFYRLGMVDADINRGMMRDAAQTLLEIQLTQDVTPRQIGELAQEIIQTFYKFPLRLPNNLVYLFRASSLVEGIALQYDPKFNGVRAATPIVKRMLREIAFRGRKPLKDRIVDGAKEAVITLRELTVIIHRLEREQLRLRIHEADIFELERFFNVFLRRLLSGIGLAVLGLIVVNSLTTYRYPFIMVGVLVLIAVLYFAVSFLPIPRGGTQRNRVYFK